MQPTGLILYVSCVYYNPIIKPINFESGTVGDHGLTMGCISANSTDETSLRRRMLSMVKVHFWVYLLTIKVAQQKSFRNVDSVITHCLVTGSLRNVRVETITWVSSMQKQDTKSTRRFYGCLNLERCRLKSSRPASGSKYGPVQKSCLVAACVSL